MTDAGVPLIWTSRGNLPVSALTHEVEWHTSPEQIVFIERYRLGGDIVKQSSHVHILTGVSILGESSM